MKINKLLQLLKNNAQPRAEGSAIRSETASDGVHLYVYDVIDSWFGASAQALVQALAGAGDQPVHLHINSPGGDVFEARAMASAIVAHTGTVTSHIDGLCASAATYLALAANEVRMTEGGMFMIHNSWTLAYGNAKELQSTAALLDKIDQSITADYAKKTKMSTQDIAALMEAETWYTAAEAFDAGFVDAVDPNTKAALTSASAQARTWDLIAYANAPKRTFTAEINPSNTRGPVRQMLTPDDKTFLKSMSGHQSQAVTMATDFITASPDSEVREFAECIVETQTGEVALMNLWIGLGSAEPAEPVADQVATQLQANRNRLRALAITL